MVILISFSFSGVKVHFKVTCKVNTRSDDDDRSISGVQVHVVLIGGATINNDSDDTAVCFRCQGACPGDWSCKHQQ